MSKRATEDLLADLHSALAKSLLAKVMAGEASGAEIAAAIKFLKDNNITASIEQNGDLGKLAEYTLPKFDDDEDYAIN